MAVLAWIICIATFLGGFVAQQDFARPFDEILSIGLFTASFLACPAL